MGWWKKLKGWQKGGVLLGGLHMIFYGIGMILFGVTAGYFVIILELPWAFIIKSVGFQGDLMFFPFDLLVVKKLHLLLKESS